MKVPWSSEPWRRAAVYGLGVSGRGASSFLLRRGVEVVAFDRRRGDDFAAGELAELEDTAGVELRLGAEPEELPAGVDGMVVSPGVPPDRPLVRSARRRGVPVIAEVELAFPFLDGPVVAITGSNGKSTTTALAGAMLGAGGRRVEVCGNIGEALTDRVDGDPGRIFVVELSSFQLEAVERFRPDSAALLNVSADHLDRHADLESYRNAKATIFRRQRASDVAVLNAGDPLVRTLVVPARRRFFASEEMVEDGCHPVDGAVVEVAPGAEPTELFRTGDVPLPGPHNLENAMAAALLARSRGVAPAAIRDALRGFRGLPHRLERVAERDGVVFFDDSKGTNPAATLRSLEAFDDGTVHVVLGGRFKGGELDELRAVAERKARRAYLIGESAGLFERALGGTVAVEVSGTLERAVAAAAGAARSGEVVLLSPACASFDQFASFADRGRRFQEIVRELVHASDGGDGDGDGADPRRKGGGDGP